MRTRIIDITGAVVIVLTLCGIVALAGCASGTLDALMYPSFIDVKRMAELESKERSTYAEARSKEHQAMGPEAAEEIARIKADSDAKIAKIIEEREKYRGTVATAFEKLGKDSLAMALEMAGIPSSITDKLLPKIDAASGDANEANVAAASIGIQLESLKDLQLTPAELEALKGMSTSDLLAMLVAAGSAAGIGIAGGRSGKSRSHSEIQEIRKTVSTLTASVERAKPPIT